MTLVKIRRLLKIVILSVCIVGFLLMLGQVFMLTRPTNHIDNKDKVKQQEMMTLILDAGELAPIPKQAKIESIATEGNMFTRSFRLRFRADNNTTDEWLRNSNGVRSVKPVKDGAGEKYILNVKHDYQYGEVCVDYSKRKVQVYLSES